jgi:hypothetical protein
MQPRLREGVAPGSYEEDSRNTWSPPKRYRVGPPPVVGTPLAGLGRFRRPAVLGQQCLRIVDAEASRGTAPGEGCQKWQHYRRGQKVTTHEICAEETARYRQCTCGAQEISDGGFVHVEEEAFNEPHGRLLGFVASLQECL